MTCDVVFSSSMNRTYSKKFGSTRSKKLSWRNYLDLCIFPFMSKAPAKREIPEVSARLQAVRHLVAGDNQTLFSGQIGIDVKRWNNFERGSPLSKEVAILLVRKVPGLTLDWLYLGIESGLPLALQRELAAAGNANTSPPTALSAKS